MTGQLETIAAKKRGPQSIVSVCAMTMAIERGGISSVFIVHAFINTCFGFGILFNSFTERPQQRNSWCLTLRMNIQRMIWGVCVCVYVFVSASVSTNATIVKRYEYNWPCIEYRFVLLD